MTSSTLEPRRGATRKEGRIVNKKLFRRRPMLVEAMSLTETNLAEVADWSGATVANYAEYPLSLVDDDGPVLIHYGDYIVRDETGKFHVMSKETFLASYEPVI